jgi:hypothetical protein
MGFTDEQLREAETRADTLNVRTSSCAWRSSRPRATERFCPL